MQKTSLAENGKKCEKQKQKWDKKNALNQVTVQISKGKNGWKSVM